MGVFCHVYKKNGKRVIVVDILGSCNSTSTGRLLSTSLVYRILDINVKIKALVRTVTTDNA